MTRKERFMTVLTEYAKKPIVQVVLSLVVGLALGLLFAWQIWPVQWVDQPVENLRPDLRMEYMRTAIDSFQVNQDLNLAARRYGELGPYAYTVFQEIKADPGMQNPQAIALLEQQFTQVGLMSPSAPQTAEPPASNGGNGFLTIAAVLGGLLALVVLGGAAYYLFRSSRHAGVPASAAAQAAEITRNIEKTDFSAVAQTPPVAQYVTTYVLGDDLFDDSFSIDSQAGEFLGECGVGISETIGVGDPKKVTAFEVWMFDKNDIQTVTKVLMSTHAFNDAAIRAKLESKGELTMVEPHRQVVLETQTLQMVVTVMDAQYGQSALPDDSYFERITLELAIWSK